MKRKLSLILIFFLSLTLSNAQDFNKMGGRAKSKLAKQEKKDAKKDKEFQAMMGQAHTHFENNEFDQALTLYKKAGERRPLNVYPKVKAEDVELAMKNYDEDVMIAPDVPSVPEKVDKEKVEEPIVEDPNIEEKRIEKAYNEEIKKAEDKVNTEVPPPTPPKLEDPKERTDKIVVRKEEDLKPLSESEIRKELGKTYEDGIHETSFEEGKKIITERIIVKDGLGDIYRRVVHQWGGKFYFKNNKSISVNTWEQTYK